MEAQGERTGATKRLAEFVGRVAPSPHHSTAAIDAATAEVLDAFESVGIEALVLKGPALGALLYDAGEQRSYSDADLMVAPDQLEAAEQALRSLGYMNSEAIHGVDDVGGVVHADAWIRAAPGDQTMIDLHRWLAGARAAPEVAWEALARRRVWIDVAGRQVAVLDRAGQAMHLAMHAAQHGPGFARPLDELALALERWPADVWESAAALAHEIGAIDGFAAGLRLLPQGAARVSQFGLPSTAELDWAIAHRSSRPRGTFHLQSLGEAEDLGEKARILRRSLLPGRAWIVYEHPWAQGGRFRLIAAYGAHLARAPGWAARAWLFSRRARRARRVT